MKSLPFRPWYALIGLPALLIALATAGWALPFERTEERARCTDYDPLKRPYFGDLHVHTTLSFDAWGQGTRNTPDDAYRFAKGEALGIQPYDENGRPLRRAQLDRPLDFAMVSDHAELFGETRVCRAPGYPGYDSWRCRFLRRWPRLAYMIVNSQWSRGERFTDVCGDDGAACAGAARGPWQETQEAAESHYDRSPACRFTTFVGYEWSGTRAGMIHRNVLFRNARVPADPISAIDTKNDERELWQRLERACIDADDGCDVLTIPHNSNVSVGSMFWTESPDGGPIDRATAQRRARLETVAEITQHKGDSECRANGNDELCSFETFTFAETAGHASRLMRSPVPPNVYLREALAEGMKVRAALGINPFKLGFIGSTDTHLGTPGLVDEESFPGHAAGAVTARFAVPSLPDHPLFNPGGLAVVWAEENSRDALFAAMRRREVYGTSGPRIVTRFFGGWDLPHDACERSDFVARGYADGVPMGSDLPARPAEVTAPVFAALALRDPGANGQPGTALQRIQIVKGWIAEDGTPYEHVYDIAGDTSSTASVDLNRCTPQGNGHDRLCHVWQDPDFSPAVPSYYYARIVENPSCRWTTHACLRAGVDCAEGSPRGLLAACCDPQTPKTIQERAWTSPIWYVPKR